MIVWSKEQPTTQYLESFVYCFQDVRFSEHLMGDCDLAFLSLPSGGFLSLIVPRSEGTREVLGEVWHLSVTPYYPYTDVISTPGGVTGLTESTGSPLRCRVDRSTGLIESISIFDGTYTQFVECVMKRAFYSGIKAWFVSQPDATLRFQFSEPEPGSRHEPLSLNQNYHPTEYLCS